MMTERIYAIDAIRGLAVLGLIPMNILSFALPFASYMNPMAYQGQWWFTHVSYSVTHVIFDQKMMGIFSLLFGCSLVMIRENNIARGRSAAMRHYVRNFWLLMFGVLHAVFMWEGDILAVYAVIAFFIYPFARLSPKLLMSLSVLLWCCVILINSSLYDQLHALPDDQLLNNKFWNPTAAHLKEMSERFLASYRDLLNANLGTGNEKYSTTSELILNNFMLTGILRAIALMLFGMAVIKANFWRNPITNERYKQGKWLIFIGWVTALLGVFFNYHNQWDLDVSLSFGMLFNLVATPMCVCGYILVFKYWIEQNYIKRVALVLSNVGKMALTNYIVQSLLMGTIFFGFGLGLYGSLNRLEILGFVIVLWGVQVAYSIWWLKHFKRGPLESCWRFLSGDRL